MCLRVRANVPRSIRSRLFFLFGEEQVCGENALLPVKTGDLNVERGEGEHVNARHAPRKQIRGEGDGMHGGGYGLRERVVWTRVVRMKG